MSYVGLTFNENRRKQEHIKESKTSDRKFHLEVREKGIDSFEYEVLESGLDVSIIGEREKYYIKKYNCICPNGYNMTSGGQVTERCEETRTLISNSQKGHNNSFYQRRHTQEHIEHLRTMMSGEGNPMFGRTHIETTREKMVWSEEKKNSYRTRMSGTYVIEYECGSTETVTNLNGFSKTRGYLQSELSRVLNKGGRHKDIISISRV